MSTIVEDATFVSGAAFVVGGEPSVKANRVRDDAIEIERRITERFFEVGRMGGNTLQSVHRAEWEFLRALVDRFAGKEIPA